MTKPGFKPKQKQMPVKPFFTVENAAEMGRRSAEAKKRQAELVETSVAVLLPADNSYVERRIARVRLQIERLSDLMDSEDNPQAIDRLASALDRLGKLEFSLSGRPFSGNRKPAPERSVRSAKRDLGATELAPQPPPVAYNPSAPDAPNG